MSNNRVLNGQARKMVYDVNCYMQKETNEIVHKLKQAKNTAAETSNTIQENLTSSIQLLHLVKNRSTNAVDKSVLLEICSKLDRIQKDVSEANKTNENKLQEIVNILKCQQKRTALATNTSVSTLRNIANEVKNSDSLTVFNTPGKAKQGVKRVTDIDNFAQGVLRRCIHNFYFMNKCVPTIEKLKQKLQVKINFTGSQRSLGRVIKDLGFKWKKTENNKKVLIEAKNIRLKRVHYLQKIKKYREEGRPIVYISESYIDSSHLLNSTKSLKTPIKRQSVVIVHAGSAAGFVPNALLTVKTESKLLDNHKAINYETYENWLRTQLIPNVPPNSVIVVDNDAFNNNECDNAPSANASKDVIQAWLFQKRIQYNENLLKSQLYQLVKTYQDQYKTINIDKILAENNHAVLRLPPYHHDLNPFEMVWSTLKQYVGSKSETWDIDNTVELVKVKVDLMGAQDWQIPCNNIESIEQEYANSDRNIDFMMEELSIPISDDSSGSEESKDSDAEMSENDGVLSTSGFESHFIEISPSSMEGISILPED